MTAHRDGFSVSMLGWAFNEEESLAAYIARAGSFLAEISDNYELVLIDDGSTDRTWEIAQEAARVHSWLRVYRNDRNRGSGYNTKRAISLASKQYLFWQTVDWAYDITRLKAMVPMLADCDVVQGVRQSTMSVPGLLFRRSDNAYKGVVSVVNYLLIRVLFRLPLGDYQNVTVYPTRLIQSVRLESESSFTNPECLLKTWWKGASFAEVHVPFIKRDKGRGTGTRPRALLAAMTDIVRWWTRWIVLGRRPDKGRGRVVTIPPDASTHHVHAATRLSNSAEDSVPPRA
jgi:hypothetical protein